MDVKPNLGAALLVILKEMHQLHFHLSQVLEREGELAADCKIEDLEQIQKRKIEIAGKIQQLESERQASVVKICTELNLDPKLQSLKKLAQFFDDKTKTDLLDLHSLLLAEIEKIKENGRSINRRTKARLISLNETTNQIDKWMALHTFYSRFGNLKSNPQTRYISRQI